MNDTPPFADDHQLNRLFATLLAMVLVMLAISGWAWINLPEDARIVVGWDFEGNPRQLASKASGLLVQPGIAFVMAVVLRLIPLIEPRRRNLRRSFTAYRVISISTVAFLLFLHAIMVSSALGYLAVDIVSAVGVLMGILFIALGNYLGKLRNNFLVGIRTPWTLSSNVTWDKTHRLGGRVFVAVGIAGVIVNLISDYGLTLLTLLVTVSALGLVAYSYVIWRQAPDRHQS